MREVGQTCPRCGGDTPPGFRFCGAAIAAQETIVDALAVLPTVLWTLGLPAQSLRVEREGHAKARSFANPVNVVYACYWSARLSVLRGEPEKVREYAEAALARSNDREFMILLGSLRGFLAWALGKQHRGEDAVRQMRTAFDVWRNAGGELHVPFFLGSLADGCRDAGKLNDALEALTEGIELAQRSGMGDSEADLYRLKGEVLMQKGPYADAEKQFASAIELARRQGARMFELRATTSLARLLQREGRVDEARRALGAIYGWFTEGFETRDLREAKQLLDTLG